MNFNQRRENDILIIDLSGWLDADSSDLFQEQFDIWSESASKFVFNCKDLEFVDSTGLGSLLLGLKATMKKDGDIRLATVNEKVQMFLEITKANDIFQIFDTVENAVASYT